MPEVLKNETSADMLGSINPVSNSVTTQSEMREANSISSYSMPSVRTSVEKFKFDEIVNEIADKTAHLYGGDTDIVFTGSKGAIYVEAKYTETTGATGPPNQRQISEVTIRGKMGFPTGSGEEVVVALEKTNNGWVTSAINGNTNPTPDEYARASELLSKLRKTTSQIW